MEQKKKYMKKAYSGTCHYELREELLGGVDFVGKNVAEAQKWLTSHLEDFKIKIIKDLVCMKEEAVKKHSKEYEIKTIMEGSSFDYDPDTLIVTLTGYRDVTKKEKEAIQNKEEKRKQKEEEKKQKKEERELKQLASLAKKHGKQVV